MFLVDDLPCVVQRDFTLSDQDHFNLKNLHVYP